MADRPDPGSVLVVDDDAVNRKLLIALLEREGHRVTVAETGGDALRILKQEDRPFDVVLLDLVMPEMDGYEVLDAMRADDRLRPLPVVVITSVDELDSAVKCIEMGADDYLSKPFDPVLLSARVRAGLAKKRLHDLELEQREESRRMTERLEARIDEQMAELVRTGELRRFMPTQVAEGLLAGELAPEQEPERRRITVLFADMVGFTDLSESLEPEELAEVLNDYLREMTSAAMTYGGTLDNFIGDGLMVLFGAPVKAEEKDQAWAAVQAADEMRTRIPELAKRLRGKGIPADLRVRVGINTGHCTVGVFGSEVMRAYKAVGFAVNVAARLQTAADPGSILCGFRTYAMVQDRVRAEQKEPLMVKGATRPVEAWEILELSGESS
ncbi:MAG TPA: adenylate/guanylate cyclase domain-containing protein [Actinomycetota bacterium]|nr:adenylate/guanylate cyclase domain-containing protein [Actinomycetota bacterium]